MAKKPIDAPGIYDIPASVYHADPCPLPSLSSSIAKLLVANSPRHAWWAHPRLNPEWTHDQDAKFDLGTAAHALVLEGLSDSLELVDAADWKSKAAQAARERARTEGRTALLMSQWERVQMMVATLREQLALHADPPIPLAEGRPEETLIWREDDIWCRARLDWLHADGRVIDDYKTSSTANPEAWSRILWALGYDVQAAFYLRGLHALTGVDAAFRFVAQEITPPYAVSVVGLAPDALALAEKKVEFAIAQWRECLNANRWPAYAPRTYWMQAPAWEEARWLGRTYRDETRQAVIEDDGRPIGDLLFGDRP